MIIFVLIWPVFQKHLGESILHTILNQNYSKKISKFDFKRENSNFFIVKIFIKSLKINFWHEIQVKDFLGKIFNFNTVCVKKRNK